MFTRLNEQEGTNTVVGFDPKKRCFIFVNNFSPLPVDIYRCISDLNSMAVLGYRLLDRKILECCSYGVSLSFNRVLQCNSPRYMMTQETFTKFTAVVIPEYGSNLPLRWVSLPSLDYTPRCYMVLSKLKTFSEYV